MTMILKKHPLYKAIVALFIVGCVYIQSPAIVSAVISGNDKNFGSVQTVKEPKINLNESSIYRKATSWSRTFTGMTDIRNAYVTVVYRAEIRDCGTGERVEIGGTVPVGTKLRFVPVPHQDTDIAWFGVGRNLDTPYGHWVSNFDSPISCTDADFFSAQTTEDWGLVEHYGTFNVRPPKFSFDLSESTAGLREQSNGCYEVTSPGRVRSRFVFAETRGGIYYGRNNGYSVRGGDYRCDLNSNIAGCELVGQAPTCTMNFVRNFTVPEQDIRIALGAEKPKTPPNPPRINGSFNGTTEITRNIAESFSFQATDPDGDDIRYLIDWNMDGEVDMRRPAGSGGDWTTSGTAIYQSHSWGTAGTYTFRAKTRDEYGLDSDWTEHTVVINKGVNITSCTASPNPAGVGEQVTWTVNHTGGTAPYIYSWSGSGGLTGSNQTKVKTYDNYGSGQKVANVTVTDSVGASDTVDCDVLILNAPSVPGMTGSITANPGIIDAGSQTTVTWSSANTESCRVFSDPSGYNWTGTGGSQLATLNRSTDFVLECRQSSSAAYELIDYVSVNVNIPPQCDDDLNNDSDSLIDEADPGCWSDPTDPSTYDPTDDDEEDPIVGNPPTCNGFDYTWGPCIGGVETQTVSQSYPLGCTGGTPAPQTRSCVITPPTCNSFTYSSWGPCVGGIETRTITSSGPNGCIGGAPESLTRACTVTGVPEITASKPLARTGEAVNISWRPNGHSCVVSDNLSTYGGMLVTSEGTESVVLDHTTTYSINCTATGAGVYGVTVQVIPDTSET